MDKALISRRIRALKEVEREFSPQADFPSLTAYAIVKTITQELREAAKEEGRPFEYIDRLLFAVEAHAAERAGLHPRYSGGAGVVDTSAYASLVAKLEKPEAFDTA